MTEKSASGTTKDISKELYQAIETTFRYAINQDKELLEFIKKAGRNKLLYEEAYRGGEKIGRHASESLLKFCDKELLPDGKMYYNIAVKVVRPMLEEAYYASSNLAVSAQKADNERRGLGMKAIEPKLNPDRVNGIVNRISSEDDFDKIKWILGDPVETLILQAVTDTVHTNAEAQWKAGLKTIIVRIANSNCCRWCREREGTYDYEEHRETGDEIWRRHRKCKCRVFFDNHSGKVQDSHSKKIYRPQELIDSYEMVDDYSTARKIKEELIEKAKRKQREYTEHEIAEKRRRINLAQESEEKS